MITAAILFVYQATVTKVDDGDTVKVHIAAFEGTPFANLSVRINGIDTPETHKPPAKCVAETKAGLDAAQYGKSLLKPGDKVTVQYTGMDKYGGRIDGNIIMADGRDWSQVMLASGKALPYYGATKPDWCKLLKNKKP